MSTEPLAVCHKKSKKTPCFGCDERQVGCHSTCEKYIQYSQHRCEQIAKAKEAYMNELIIEDMHIKGALKTLHRKKWG